MGRFLDNNGPKGVTPLASRLTDIRRRIEVERRELMTTGQRVVLVIATDGLPTSPYGGQSNQQDRRDLVQALRALSVLDVHIVLRLCTDQTDVVDYYGDFDKEVELSLEVLDDLTAEARELSKVGNSLLTYTPLLHRVREGGTFFKVLDVIDERALTPGEIYLLAQMLLRRSPDDALLPREPTEFCNEVERRLKANPAGQYFEPLYKKLAPPMDAYYLLSAMGLTGVSAAMKWVEGLMWGNCRPPEWIKLPRLTL